MTTSKACPECGNAVVGQVNKVYCSPRCKKRVMNRRAAEVERRQRAAIRAARRCSNCGVSTADRGANVVYCTACYVKAASARKCEAERRRRASLPKPERYCATCPSLISERGPTAVYCQSCKQDRERIAKRAQMQRVRAAERVGSLSGKRTCLDCPTDLTGSHGLAPRCQPCRAKRRAAMQAENSRLRRRRHAAAVQPKPARAPKPTPTPKVVQPKAVRPTPPPPKPKEKIEKANLDGGPWFPGWNGCYPPWRTPFEIQLLESEVGRPKIKQVDVTKQPKFRTGSQRFPIHADEEVA